MTKQQRESALSVDQTAIDQANQTLKVLIDPPTVDAVNQAKAAVDAAQQQLALAQKPYTAQDIAQAEAAVRSAQAAVQLAARPYTREDAETALAGVAQAQATVDLVRTQIDNAAVTAPVDGVVSKKIANEGDMASPTSPLVTLASTSWEVSVPVAEEAAAQVHVGDQARMTASAFPDQPFAGTITTIAPLVDVQARTLTIKVEPTGSTPPVRGGMSIRIEIPTAIHNDVLLIPKSAVLTRDGRSAVFTVESGRAHGVPVKLGPSDDTSVQIVEGLEPSTPVVTNGQELLAEGDQVVSAND